MGDIDVTGGETAAGRKRATRSRRAIAEAVARLERSFSARELHDLVCAEGRAVGLTTVYRTLALLLAEGRVREAGRRDGEMLYNACTVTGHHHHLVCERCGTVAESSVCRCEELEVELGESHGFVLSRTAETYYGLCAACARRPETVSGEGSA
jgi:Fur family ferric uptake transcriptional regulator